MVCVDAILVTLLLLHSSLGQGTSREKRQAGRGRGGRRHHPHRPPGFPLGPNLDSGNIAIAFPQGRPPIHSHQNQPRHCTGHRRNLPECQRIVGGVGARPNQFGQIARPNEEGEGGGVGGQDAGVGVGGQGGGNQEIEINPALFEIPWLYEITTDNQSVILPGLPETPTFHSQETRFYQLANKVQDTPFQTCITPGFEFGHCRYLQHCVLSEFVFSFQEFLQYVCFINGVYVGVCCPDSRYPHIVTTARPPTTPATTTKRPPTPPTSKGCGINSIPMTRIVGGRDAELNKYPWAAALLRATSSNQYCGGILITDKHVLTAAHCVDGIETSTITVRLGEYSFDQQDDAPHKDYKLISADKHDKYDTKTYINDVAILTLDRSTDTNNKIWPVCLPSADLDFAGETATVIGWGTIYYGGPVSKTLQEVTIPVWKNADCDAAYKGGKIFPQNLCAGDKAGGKDSCQGDSGGPLMLQHGPEKRWTVIGVVSWGIRCADPGIPGVYARISQMLDWIKKKTT